MCMQCVATAMTSGAAVAGARSWLGTRRWSWLTERRLRNITRSLLGLGLIASALVLSGS